MIRINNITQRVYGQIKFGGCKSIQKNNGPSKPNGEADTKKDIAPVTNSSLYMYRRKDMTDYGKSNFSANNMPKDVLAIYGMSRALSGAISNRLPEINGNFGHSDVTLTFDKNGKVVQICDSKPKKDGDTEYEYDMPDYYAELKSFADRNYSPLFVSNGSGVLQVQNMRFENGRLTGAMIRGADGTETFKILYKNGFISRFEFSKQISPTEKIIQILDFEDGKPSSYIRLECPTEEISTKNIKWMKFYNYNDGSWFATPKD